MKKMIMIGVYGLLILGASAGGTWYLRQQDMAAKMAEENTPDPLTESAADLTTPVDVTRPLPPQQPPETNAKELPIAVRPGEMSVEEIVRYGLGLKAREAAIRDREESLRRTETQHRLVLADIEGEQKEIEGLVAQARDQRLASEQLLSKANQERLASEKLLKELDDKKQKAELDRQKTSAKTGAADEGVVDRAANIKEMVSWVEGMTPENASKLLRSFANDGKVDTAVEVLSKMEERKAAAILNDITETDETLGSELLSKVAEMKRPTRL